MSPRPSVPKGSDLLAALFTVVLVAGLALGAAAEVSGWLVSHRLPAFRGGALSAAAVILGHPGDPGFAWRESHLAGAPSPAGYWAVATAIVAIVAGLIGVMWRLMRDRGYLRRRQGFASRHQVRHLRRREVSPSPAQSPAPAPLGVERVLAIDVGIDQATGQQMLVRPEDSILMLGPPRCGKTASGLIPNLVTWGGSVLATSTRPELCTMTAHLRPGPVYIFDPTHMIDTDRRAGWSPIEGCDHPMQSILRARALVGASAAGKGVSNGDYFADSAATLLRCLFHAAAISGQDVRTVESWLADPDGPTPYHTLLDAPRVPLWAGHFRGIQTTGSRERASIYNSARRALGALADPLVLESCCPPAGLGINFETVLREGGSIYVVADSRSQEAIAPLVAAMAETLIDTARRLAARMSEGRLDPPLALFLDEAAQIAPIPSLPKVMSDGGGSGITTVVVLQSLSQARERWGRQAADAMWNAATTKLIFGGIAEDEDLESISRLCGEIDTESRSVSRGRGFDSETIAPQRRRLLESAAIRGLNEGTVLLLYRRFPPILAHLAPWWQRRIAPLIRQRVP